MKAFLFLLGATSTAIAIYGLAYIWQMCEELDKKRRAK
jgi:hypothetical protein